MRRLIGKRLVVVESPFAAGPAGDVLGNVAYARSCILDCLMRLEAPFASHLLYAQPGVLDDLEPDQRQLGITAGFAWGDIADVRVVYTDRGVSPGMKMAIERSQQIGQPVEYRKLGGAHGAETETAA